MISNSNADFSKDSDFDFPYSASNKSCRRNTPQKPQNTTQSMAMTASSPRPEIPHLNSCGALHKLQPHTKSPELQRNQSNEQQIALTPKNPSILELRPPDASTRYHSQLAREHFTKYVTTSASTKQKIQPNARAGK